MAEPDRSIGIIVEYVSGELEKVTAAEAVQHLHAEQQAFILSTLVEDRRERPAIRTVEEAAKDKVDDWVIANLVEKIIEIEDVLHESSMMARDKGRQEERLKHGVDQYMWIVDAAGTADRADAALLHAKLKDVDTKFAEDRAAANDKVCKLLRDGRRKAKDAQGA